MVTDSAKTVGSVRVDALSRRGLWSARKWGWLEVVVRWTKMGHWGTRNMPSQGTALEHDPRTKTKWFRRVR